MNKETEVFLNLMFSKLDERSEIDFTEKFKDSIRFAVESTEKADLVKVMQFLLADLNQADKELTQEVMKYERKIQETT